MVHIRMEKPDDVRAIWEVTKSAFDGKAYAAGNEQELINQLRAAGALALSLVAVESECVVGQVCFSTAALSSRQGEWYALGPISVVPEHQRNGIGAALIESGVDLLAQRGASGCILIGNPHYYSRHGFELAPRHCPENESKSHFQLRLIGDVNPVGIFSFHPVFYQST